MAWRLKEQKDGGKNGVYFSMEDPSQLVSKRNPATDQIEQMPLTMNHLIVGKNLTKARIRQIIEDRTLEETGEKITLKDNEITLPGR